MICLTFDTDHMTPDWMDRFLGEAPLPGRGTFFMWAPFPGLDWRGHVNEPHPHFEHLPDAPGQLKAFFKTLEHEAPRGFRAHSCVTSHMICLAAKQVGVEYVSMASPTEHLGLKPYRHPWGVWEMPIYYMDNMDFCTPENWPDLDHKPFRKGIIEDALNEDGLYVFDFHPLHIALNTPNFGYYQTIKDDLLSRRKDPWQLRSGDYGTANFYEDLCEAMDKKGIKSVSLCEALDAYKQGGDAALTRAA